MPKQKKKKILVPVDGSGRALKTVRYVARAELISQYGHRFIPCLQLRTGRTLGPGKRSPKYFNRQAGQVMGN